MRILIALLSYLEAQQKKQSYPKIRLGEWRLPSCSNTKPQLKRRTTSIGSEVVAYKALCVVSNSCTSPRPEIHHSGTEKTSWGDYSVAATQKTPPTDFPKRSHSIFFFFCLNSSIPESSPPTFFPKFHIILTFRLSHPPFLSSLSSDLACLTWVAFAGVVSCCFPHRFIDIRALGLLSRSQQVSVIDLVSTYPHIPCRSTSPRYWRCASLPRRLSPSPLHTQAAGRCSTQAVLTASHAIALIDQVQHDHFAHFSPHPPAHSFSQCN